MYGPHDSFCPVNGHVIGSLIGKATSNMNDYLSVNGTGEALRQFMYVEDFARIVVQSLANPRPCQDLICASKEEISISDVATMIAKNSGKDIVYDTSMANGQYRKYAISKIL